MCVCVCVCALVCLHVQLNNPFDIRSLASEWGKYGMRFNCIAPGPIETKVRKNIMLFVPNFAYTVFVQCYIRNVNYL